VSRIKELEARLARAEQQLRLLQEVSRFMVRDGSLQEILAGANRLLVDFMECDSCLIYLLDHGELTLCSSNQGPVNGSVRLKMNEGLTGWVARERRLLAISREAYLDPRFKHFATLEADTYEAFLSAPILARNRVVGVINVQHRGPHAHSGAEMETLATIGEQIGTLLVLAQRDGRPSDPANALELLAPAGGPAH
jgi:uroporphyrinogen-III synthase